MDKKYPIVVLLIMLCYQGFSQENLLLLNINFPDTLLESDVGLIKVDILNNSDHAIVLSNPNCYGLNSLPRLFDGSTEIQANYLFRIDPACGQETFKIEGRHSMSFDYKYSVRMLFTLRKNYKYKLVFEYFGNIATDSEESEKKSEMFSAERTFLAY